MSKLTELRNLLQRDQTVSGRVVAVSSDRVRVATSSGVVEVAGGANLKPGDTVTVQNGRVVKKRIDGAGSVFFV